MGGDLRWVWDANRNHPVRENATLTFGTDGNLVLADVDGSIVWQTKTADKGVTGISMQTDGNLILRNKKGKRIWQSFQHPTDTLAVGQALALNGNTKLVSRTSDRNSRDGPYSATIDGEKGFIMYQNASGELVQYAGWEAKGLSDVTFRSIRKVNPVQPPPTWPYWEMWSKTSYFLSLGFAEGKQAITAPSRRVVLKITGNHDFQHWPFLRLESDGNLVVYSYRQPEPKPYSNGWSKEYAFFGDTVKECALQSKCGSSGKCYGRLCSACPRNSSLGCIIRS
ncbi:hypothetical protein MKW94_004581 [Papaver nudicaule]|uniref:Bulb-type lectin domain-containing protein n=1 Tax=Papaver nudicaule TaxID=74823 RepID=A0AA41V7H8_PAPNU|nr:hypothetical protein [Papaver nudicaule]